MKSPQGRLMGNLRLLRRSPMLLLTGLLVVCLLGTGATMLVVSRVARPPASHAEVPAPPIAILVTPNVPPAVLAVPTSEAPISAPGAWTPALVTRVVDGDTVIVDIAGQSERLRFIGMDTPETVHPSKPVQCFGAEATARTTAILAGVGGRVWLEKDVSERDRYARLLRYVWLGPDPGSPMLNEQLVAQGYASVSTFPPDVRYQDRFLAAERAARAAGRGLWGGCGGPGIPLSRATPRP